MRTTYRVRFLGLTFAALAIPLLAGCFPTESLPANDRTAQADRQVRAKWGKGLSELPVATLVIISPHNDNIRREYEWAFSLQHAIEHGQTVRFDWRNVGGGGSTIVQYLRNVYGRTDSSGIDVLWGGGELNFTPLAREGIFQPLDLKPDVLQNIPPELGGVPLYDSELRWVGAAVSAFGFIYNAGLLERCGIEPPANWDDLGDPRFADLVALADPTQSGSAAAAYQMIARSGSDWPDGWSKLLRILSSAKRFTDNAGSAANSPALGEALVAACIDFYGTIRVAEAPDQLVYVSPRGQTTFSPDPIAILKNPPNPELAQRFVDFVMSPQGQALWALPVGHPHGPMLNHLGRQPVRRDVYQQYGPDMPAAIVNPYQVGQSMSLDEFRRKIDFGVLRQLVRVAAIDNTVGLRAARAKLIKTNYPPHLLAQFNRLPDNVATIEAIAQTKADLKDETKREIIITDWQEFFRNKYQRICRAEDG